MILTAHQADSLLIDLFNYLYTPRTWQPVCRSLLKVTPADHRAARLQTITAIRAQLMDGTLRLPLARLEQVIGAASRLTRGLRVDSPGTPQVTPRFRFALACFLLGELIEIAEGSPNTAWDWMDHYPAHTTLAPSHAVH